MFDENRDKAGLIVRVFVKDPQEQERVVRANEELLENALSLKQKNGKKHYRDIVLIVTADNRFPDHDTCRTDVALRAMIGRHSADKRWAKTVFVHKVDDGDPFCLALNRGIRLLSERGVTHATIISFGVRKYLTQEFVDQTFALFNQGATVVGGVLPELRNSIGEGRVANTLCTWQISDLMDVGGFAFTGRQHQLLGATHTIQTTDGKTYPLQGVEEIVPLIWQAMRQTREGKVNPFIGLVYPEGHEQWEVLDPVREAMKMGTKGDRQSYQALTAGGSLSLLAESVLPECRRQ